jgi:hypothetical protein
MAHDVAKLIFKQSQESEANDVCHIRRLYLDPEYSFACHLKRLILKGAQKSHDWFLLSSLENKVPSCVHIRRDSSDELFGRIEKKIQIPCSTWDTSNIVQGALMDVVLAFRNEECAKIFFKCVEMFDLKLIGYRTAYTDKEIRISWSHWKQKK